MKYYITYDNDGLFLWRAKPYWNDEDLAFADDTGYVDRIDWDTYITLTNDSPRLKEGEMIEVEYSLPNRINKYKRKHH